MANTPRVGLDCKLYRNTATYASPTWNEVTVASDVTIPMEADAPEARSRASVLKQYLVAAIDTGVEFEILYDPAGDDFAVLQGAFFGRTSVEFAVMDGAIATAGTQGLRATCFITGFSRNENRDDAVTVTVTAKPAATAANPPAWYTVSA